MSWVPLRYSLSKNLVGKAARDLCMNTGLGFANGAISASAVLCYFNSAHNRDG